MSFFSIVKVELVKLFYKKTTLLSLLNFIIPLIFGIGMMSNFSFFVGEGVDAVSKELSATDFATNMLGQSKYLLFFVSIILASFSIANELESGQMKSEITRICSRPKILIAKYSALMIILGSVLLLFTLWCYFIYYIMVINSSYASGEFSGQFMNEQVYYLLFTFIGIAVATAFTMLLGMKLKTFPCFAIGYILWFISLYSDFFGELKLSIPYNLPDYVLEQAGNTISFLPYVGLFFGYCVILITLAVVLFQRMDLKT